jgi:hypothetical protein
MLAGAKVGAAARKAAEELLRDAHRGRAADAS